MYRVIPAPTSQRYFGFALTCLLQKGNRTGGIAPGIYMLKYFVVKRTIYNKFLQ